MLGGRPRSQGSRSPAVSPLTTRYVSSGSRAFSPLIVVRYALAALGLAATYSSINTSSVTLLHARRSRSAKSCTISSRPYAFPVADVSDAIACKP
jgi:hypothetical protein